MTKSVSIITLNVLICLATISCSNNQIVDNKEAKLLSDNTPDTKKQFEVLKKKFLQTKVSVLNFKVRHANFDDTKLTEGIDAKFKYTYLIWIYTGYYDSETVLHPFYIFPQTPKGKVMQDGLHKGLQLHSRVTKDKPIELIEMPNKSQ